MNDLIKFTSQLQNDFVLKYKISFRKIAKLLKNADSSKYLDYRVFSKFNLKLKLYFSIAVQNINVRYEFTIKTIKILF